ncbi:hypothetical protein BTJ39_23940 [Izhakiella australiensis]|uniref:Uncharacterized protein n=2 Tax=Izhakiella australiensis TaxID=1926881 RepID=A0A1S8Y408_9GAMM|nr:hypothetical protein BTJ39_23940 [Izhakiella australiensis]
MTELTNYFKLSIQRALLGNVTSNMRSIVAEVKNGNIQLFFYFDGEILDDDEETASQIGTEVIADFDDSFNLDVNIRRLDYPDPLRHASGICIFLRKES